MALNPYPKFTEHYTINVGLNSSSRFEDSLEAGNIAYLAVQKCQALAGPGNPISVRHVPPTEFREATIVISFYTTRSIAAVFAGIHALATTACQDCIAVKTNGKGYLLGMYAEDWGPFSDDFFLTMFEPEN